MLYFFINFIVSTECNRILVALSGGVDSAVCASILLQEGYQVEAVYVKTWEHEKDVLGDCPGALDLRDAETVSAPPDRATRILLLSVDTTKLIKKYNIFAKFFYWRILLH